MMGLNLDYETDESTQLLRQFIMDHKLKPIDLILQELAVDRAQLLRGIFPRRMGDRSLFPPINSRLFF